MKKQNQTNKKTNSRKSEKITTAVLACLLIGGVAAIGGKVYHDSTKQPGVVETIPGDEDVSIKQNGITIKKLNSVTNQDGSVTKTFTYTISPANASNKAISASAKYADGSACTDVVTVTTNTSNQTIAITCKKDFGKVINVTITSLANSSATATIKLNYTKKLKSITGIDKSITINKDSNYTFKLTDFYTPVYSAYTKDANYTFAIDVQAPHFDECTYDSNLLNKYGFEDKLETMIQNAMKNNTAFPSADDIWNISTSNAYHSALVDLTAGGEGVYIAYSLPMYVKSVENPSIKTYVEGYVTIEFGTFDYSSKTIGVDSLAAELTTIDF